MDPSLFDQCRSAPFALWLQQSVRYLGEGVYIPRRDTSSRLNTLAGGRLFPGVHPHARFQVREENDAFQVELVSDDGRTSLHVRGRRAVGLPAGSVFDSLEEASAFFERGSVGYSPRAREGRLDGLELRSLDWKVEALEVEAVRSSFFEDRANFSKGSVEFDCALLMRGVEHEWHGREPLYV